MKVNLSYVPGNVDLQKEQTMVTDYFVVRLETSRRYSTKSVLSLTFLCSTLYQNKCLFVDQVQFIGCQ